MSNVKFQYAEFEADKRYDQTMRGLKQQIFEWKNNFILAICCRIWEKLDQILNFLRKTIELESPI